MSISLKGTVSTPDNLSIAGASARLSASNQASGEIQIDEAGFRARTAHSAFTTICKSGSRATRAVIRNGA